MSFKLNLINLFAIFILFLGCNGSNNSQINLLDQESKIKVRIQNKAKQALDFCKENNFNTDFCILIDMSIHSGKNRMFIYNLNKNEIERSALCAHGSGKGNKKSTGASPIFGNDNGSFLTSLGKYKIGARAYSQFGIHVHYKLHGLEKTNDNAFKRIVVLHSYSPISETEIYPSHLPMGWSQGCPVTDDETMKFIDEKLQKIEKPVLLWIFTDSIN